MSLVRTREWSLARRSLAWPGSDWTTSHESGIRTASVRRDLRGFLPGVRVVMSSNLKSFSGLATEPAASSQHVVRDAQWAIQWVFPSEQLTVVTEKPKTLGRDSDCDTHLPSRETSRRHAEIRRDGPFALIVDLQSRNGLFVNGQRTTQAFLKDNDVVRLGDWTGIVIAYHAEVDYSFRTVVPGWFGGHKLAAVVEPAQRVASSSLPVTIQGETGTGKEGLARAIHNWSGRQGQLVAVNCATIQPDLAEATLFGHRKGAFTGADRAALGYFRAANGGTLLLDEVVELPASVQAKLLRALEENAVVPVGETEPVRVDVRVLAAMQEPLAVAVRERRFRADLMARLEGLTVVLPPLRDRREDIAPLLLKLLHEMTGGSPPAVEARFIEQLLVYDWPLNVRELVHLARQLLTLHTGQPVIRRSFLPPRFQNASQPSEPVPQKPARNATQDEVAFDQLVAALRLHVGNVARAAASLGISRARAYRLLEARPDFSMADVRAPGERE